LILIFRYFASKQKGQDYNWRRIHNWAFRSSLPTGRLAFSVQKNGEYKATGIIADIHIEKSIFPSFREAI
jgi:hypothetical protein